MPNKSNRQKPTTSQKNRILSAAPVLIEQNPNPLYQDPDVAYVNLLPENIDATIARIRASNGSTVSSASQQQLLTTQQIPLAAAPSANQPHINSNSSYQTTVPGRPRRASTSQNLAATIENLISGNGNETLTKAKLTTEVSNTARANTNARNIIYRNPLHPDLSQTKRSPVVTANAAVVSTNSAASNGDESLVGRQSITSGSPVILVDSTTIAAPSINQTAEHQSHTFTSKRSSKRGFRGGSKHDAKRVCKRNSRRIPKHCSRDCTKHCIKHCAMRCIKRRARNGQIQELKPCSRHNIRKRSIKQSSKSITSKNDPNNDLRNGSKSGSDKKQKKTPSTPSASDKTRKRKESNLAKDTANAGNLLSILPRNISSVIANLRVDNSDNSTSTAPSGNAATANSSDTSKADKRSVDPFQQLPQAYANLMPINITNSKQAKNEERLFGESRYVGINVDSVRCIWDQSGYNGYKIHSFAMQMMAEDTSYKLWELVNSLQAYTLHSGGILTTSIVNEVLKDFNVPPITNAESTKDDWEKINYNGIYYAKPVVELNLSEEYSRPDWVKDFGRLTLEAEWRSPQENGKTLKEFAKVLISCIMMGGEIPYRFGLQQAVANSSLGSILPMLLSKFCELLSFGVDDEILHRALAFLKAISHSYYARDMCIEVKHYHLANILVCLLFGPVHDVHSTKRTRREMESQRLANARSIHRLQKLLVVPQPQSQPQQEQKENQQRQQQKQQQQQQQQHYQQLQSQTGRTELSQQKPRETVPISHNENMNSQERADEQLRLVKKAQKTLTDSLRQTQKEHMKKERLLKILSKHETASKYSASSNPKQLHGYGLASNQSQASVTKSSPSTTKSSQNAKLSPGSIQSASKASSISMESGRTASSTTDHNFLLPSLPPISKANSGSKDSRRTANSKSSASDSNRSTQTEHTGKDADRLSTSKESSSSRRASTSQASSQTSTSMVDPGRLATSSTAASSTDPNRPLPSTPDSSRSSKSNAMPSQTSRTNYDTEPILIDSDQESSDGEDAGNYLFSNEYYWDTINEWPRGWPSSNPDVEANEFVSQFDTSAVDDSSVDEVCAVVGGLSGLWGYLEHEIIYLLSQRMHAFFSLRPSKWTTNHFNWLSRMIRVVTSLGDMAFRELSVYFVRIPYNEIPEWIIPLLSVGGQFVYHQGDEYLYEYLNEVCGDSLQPYLLEYTKHLERLRARRLRKQSAQVIQRVIPSSTLRILPRAQFNNRVHRTQRASIKELFPDYAIVQPKKGIKIQNSRTPLTRGNNVQASTRPLYQASCSTLNSRLVLWHRRLLVPVHIGERRKPTDHLFDNKLYNL